MPLLLYRNLFDGNSVTNKNKKEANIKTMRYMRIARTFLVSFFFGVTERSAQCIAVLSRVRSTDAPSIFLSSRICGEIQQGRQDTTRRIVETTQHYLPRVFSERSVSQRATGCSYSSHALLFDIQVAFAVTGEHLGLSLWLPWIRRGPRLCNRV